MERNTGSHELGGAAPYKLCLEGGMEPPEGNGARNNSPPIAHLKTDFSAGIVGTCDGGGEG